MMDPDIPGSGPGLRMMPIQGNSTLDPAEILAMRARALAVPRGEIRDDEDGILVLEFLLSGERYVIDMNYIREVALLKEITRIPGTPSFILGVIGLRGSILSLVDIRAVLGLPSKGLTDYNRIIVLAGEKMVFGILADSIVMTRTIRMSQVNRPPPIMSGTGISYLIGILPGPVMVLDAYALLNDPRMVVGDE
jgi:purine-binding chemotaxis protein CheW